VGDASVSSPHSGNHSKQQHVSEKLSKQSCSNVTVTFITKAFQLLPRSRAEIIGSFFFLSLTGRPDFKTRELLKRKLWSFVPTGLETKDFSNRQAEMYPAYRHSWTQLGAFRMSRRKGGVRCFCVPQYWLCLSSMDFCSFSALSNIQENSLLETCWLREFHWSKL
jgi:hypothetical protein